jgi:hypothetical protein
VSLLPPPKDELAVREPLLAIRVNAAGITMRRHRTVRSGPEVDVLRVQAVTTERGTGAKADHLLDPSSRPSLVLIGNFM